MAKVSIDINRLRTYDDLDDSELFNGYYYVVTQEIWERTIPLFNKQLGYRLFFKMSLAGNRRYSDDNAHRIAGKTKMVELYISFALDEDEDILALSEKAAKWIINRFGENHIADIMLHNDFCGPYICALIVPLTDDGRLNSREVFGNMKKLTAELKRALRS